jgi:hypothetical protein
MNIRAHSYNPWSKTVSQAYSGNASSQRPKGSRAVVGDRADRRRGDRRGSGTSCRTSAGGEFRFKFKSRLKYTLARGAGRPEGRGCLLNADGEGFEPSVPFWSTHAFQACPIDHSGTRPGSPLRGERETMGGGWGFFKRRDGSYATYRDWYD